MDHRFGLGGAHRRAGGLRVEDIEHDCRHAGAFELARLRRRARGAGDVVSGTQEQRHQPPADRAGGACEKHSHVHMLANFRSSPRGAPRDARVAGTPWRGPSARPWIPSISAFTRVHSPSETGVNALNAALCAGMNGGDRPAARNQTSPPAVMSADRPPAAGDEAWGAAGERPRGADEKETAMRYALLRTSALALAFAAGIGLAAAQQQPPAPDSQQKSQQEKAQQTPSGQMGKEEPSSHAPSAAPPANAVFVNGALAVPDAPANTDTVPAKFSAKNAADDALITIAYTFKMLTGDQRRAIFEALKGQPAAAVNADVGTELPPGIELRPVPDEVAARVPQTKGYRYAVTNDRVLLVGTSRIVVGVFGDANASVGEGRRGP